ncbi:hypothetical protein EAI_04914 [Harpegnathos saltator]|uniref:Uncharacterized protein n=1 Tax=Harpegnathos saltator TaxID=610380 RepID=E2BT55_HARSA|nr:hypothetical protein EAI_04914 [Harpegnathos saltator]
MTSRLRGPSAVKDTPRAAPFAKDHFHREPEVHSGRLCKNGDRSNRYHFGMSKHDSKAERNGRECGKEDTAVEEDSADLLYRKSRQHFAAWQIKDIVQDDGVAGGCGAKRSSRRQEHENSRHLTNGKFRSESMGAKIADKSQQDRLEYRDEGYVGSLPREDRQRGESVEREINGSHRTKRKESSSWEDMESRGRGRSSKAIGKSHDNKGDSQQQQQPIDERDILLKEIESLAVDGSQSPDRRIQAMIERLKSREENKLRSRREQRSASPEKEARGRTRSGGRLEPRAFVDQTLDNRSSERGKRPKDEHEDERRPSEPKLRGMLSDREEDRRSKSVERQPSEVLFSDKEREPRRDDSFRKGRSDTYSAEKIHRRRSREDEDEEQSRQPRDSSKRRSYAYEGSPEDFDVRIQKYDRALLEPRRDLDTPRRSSPKDPSLTRKESLKEHDREPVSKKNSFRAESKRTSSKDRESSLTRRTSFKDQDNDGYKRHVSKSPLEPAVRSTYFGKDQEDSCSRKDSFKDMSVETGRKGSFLKVQDGAFERAYLKDSSHDDVERKVFAKEHAVSGVSRIVLRNFDDESGRSNSFKNSSEDSGQRSSFKEKSIEFGGISYKDRASDSEKRNSFKEDEEGSRGRTLYHDYEKNNIDRKTANERYIEFGKVSFKTQDDELQSSSFKEKDNMAVTRTSSFKERDPSTKRRASLRNKGAGEVLDRKSDRHLRPLTPPDRKDESLESREDNGKDPKGFSAKSWYESNRVFSNKYLREHSKLRGAPEGRIDHDVSPERGLAILPDTKTAVEYTYANDPEEDPRFGVLSRGRLDPTDDEPRFSATSEHNGTTIIRIRSSEEQAGAERSRRRRRVAQEVCAVRRRKAYEDEDDDDSDEDEVAEGKERRWWARTGDGVLPERNATAGNASDATPSRTMWNYREGVWHFHESIAFDRSFMVQRREAIFINRWRR